VPLRLLRLFRDEKTLTAAVSTSLTPMQIQVNALLLMPGVPIKEDLQQLVAGPHMIA
jgi:hypothetical protein